MISGEGNNKKLWPMNDCQLDQHMTSCIKNCGDDSISENMLVEIKNQDKQ